MQIWNPAASFTRPNNTTAYAAGQLIANSVTAGAVVPMQFPISGNSQPGSTRIVRVRFAKGGLTATLSQFRLHLYASLPTCANGDGGAWSTNKAADYLGSIDGPTVLKAFTDGCADAGSAPAGSELLLRLPAGKIVFGLLQALAAYVPDANEVFTTTVEMVDDY